MPRELAHSVRVARFIRFYGASAYRSTAYPTADRVIPAVTFEWLWEAMDAVMAMEDLRAADAAALGQAMIEDGRNYDVKKARRELARSAMPMVRLDGGPDDETTDE